MRKIDDGVNFMRVPKKILRDPNLTAEERHYYFIIYDRHFYEGQGYSLQNHETMEAYGFTRYASIKILASLKLKGYIDPLPVQIRKYLRIVPIMFYDQRR